MAETPKMYTDGTGVVLARAHPLKPGEPTKMEPVDWKAEAMSLYRHLRAVIPARGGDGPTHERLDAAEEELARFEKYAGVSPAK